jgi:hypothetical protein
MTSTQTPPTSAGSIGTVCIHCGRDPELREAFGDEVLRVDHECHCVHDEEWPHNRIAVCICCGWDVGEELLAEEDAAAERRGNREQK